MIDRRVTPHYSPNVDLCEGIDVGWSDWTIVNGASLLSWLRWAVTMGYVEAPDRATIQHHHLLRTKTCHTYRGREWCFCQQRMAR